MLKKKYFLLFSEFMLKKRLLKLLLLKQIIIFIAFILQKYTSKSKEMLKREYRKLLFSDIKAMEKI